MSQDLKLAFLLVTIVFSVFLWLTFYYFFQDIGKTKKAELAILRNGIAERTLSVETTLDPFSQAKGLSGRRSLSDSDGMLFIFSEPGIRHFWMVGMRFPLDIVWIREDAVIGIAYNAEPYKVMTGAPKQYDSPADVDKVLELPAGSAEKLSLQIGDRLVVKK